MITKVILTVITSVVSTVAAAVVVERFIKNRDTKSTMAGEAPFQHREDPILKTYEKLNRPVY